MKKVILSIALINFLVSAQEATANTQADPKLTQMLMIGGMFAAVWYFMIMRPEQKKQKAKETMHSEITKGDKVITIGGICGTITSVQEDRYVIQIDKTNAVTVLKAAVDRKDEGSAEKEKTK